MQVGGNDIQRISVTNLVHKLMSLADYLVEDVGVKCVIIGQLLRRSPRVVNHLYNECVVYINKELCREAGGRQNIHYLCHRAFWSDLSHLCRDGVHLDSRLEHSASPFDLSSPMKRYWRSIRNAVIIHSRHLRLHNQEEEVNMAAKDNDDVYVNDLYRCQEVKQPEFSQFIGQVSYGLYLIACHDLGGGDMIRMRRQMTELHNEYCKLKDDMGNAAWYLYLSGSIGEGFRFSSSDIDLMFIYHHIRVIHSMTNRSQTEMNQHFHNATLLLMECDKTRPGFALLRLEGEAYSSDVQRSLIPYLSGLYVSSQIFRDENPHKLQSSIVHGPCNSGVIDNTEYDHAFCLHSDIWPTAAYGCINRLLKCKWPTLAVVNDIFRGGVHFVPITSKESQFECLEWRMSFSVAEKKLIHSMNHTQFMCYGLLKIFLKESINNIKEIDSILCSYYLKTALFWEILNPSTRWMTQNLLYCFWKCFTRLISWIYNEYLPNFFIPENNMLVGKFHPGQKKLLLDHLNMLYCEGYACLLRCPSLRGRLTYVIHRPLIVNKVFDDLNSLQKCNTEVQRISEICTIFPYPNNYRRSSQSLAAIEYLLHTNNNQDNTDALEILWRWNINVLVSMYNSTLTKSSLINNKEHYSLLQKTVCTINRCRVDCVGHYLYAGVCLYRRGRYKEVTHACCIAKRKLQNPHLMYTYTGDSEKYRAAGGEYTPFQVMLRQNIADMLCLVSMACIPELRLEHQVAGEDTTDFLTFPPLVIAEFLHCLSCYHLGYDHLVQESVNDLYMVVHYDDDYHIHDCDRAISWQILGICQEMIRDYQGAYQSYYNALQDQYSRIRPASRRRLENLV